MPSAWDALSSLGFAGRPADDSGIRAKGVKRNPLKRPKDFPYDKTDPDQMYGNPQAYDRGSNVGGALHKPLVPKGISDKGAEQMGLKIKLVKLTDEELDEVLGSPILLGKGGSSQMGSSVPGVGSGWAKNPPKDWDQEDFSKMDKAQLERIVAKLQIMKPAATRESPLQVNPAPNPDVDLGPGDTEPETDFERRMAVLVMAPDGYGSGINGNRMSSRGLYGMMPKESAWDGLKNIFGSR